MSANIKNQLKAQCNGFELRRTSSGTDELSSRLREARDVELVRTLFDLPESVSVGSMDCEIRTDFRVILEIFVMLDDPDLTDTDKTEALLRMFYVNRPSDAEEALAAFVRFADPRSQGNRQKKQSRFLDWEQDFDLMIAPINHILGTECRALRYLHWHSFLAAYLEIPPESVFARVLRIREKLRTGKKLEKYERRWYSRNRDLVHLKPKFSGEEEEILSDWTRKVPAAGGDSGNYRFSGQEYA